MSEWMHEGWMDDMWVDAKSVDDNGCKVNERVIIDVNV
jgi:hypothetical protein